MTSNASLLYLFYRKISKNNLTFIEWGWVGYEEFCKLRRVLSTEVTYTLLDLQNSSYPTKAEFNNCLLFLQNNSKFKNKLKHANLGRCKHIDNASLSGLSLGAWSLLRSANILQIADVVRRVIFFCSCDVFRQYFAVKRVKCSTTVSPFCSNYQNNSTSSPGFHGQRFNNLQKGCTFDVISSIWQHSLQIWSTAAGYGELCVWF